MSERVQFVITAQEWDPVFEEVSPGLGWGQIWRTQAHFQVPLSCDTLSRVDPSPPGPDGQPFPGVRPAPVDLQL